MKKLLSHNQFQVLAYGLPNAVAWIFTVLAVIYLPVFYAREKGLSLEVIGTVLLLARVLDAVIDPVVGSLSDRSLGRFGGRKGWIVASVPLVVIATYYLFMPTGPVDAVYLCIALIAWYFTYSAFTIPYYAWGTEIATGYKARGALIGIREACALIGVLALQGYIVIRGASTTETLQITFYAVLIFVPTTTLLAVLFVRSSNGDTIQGSNSPSQTLDHMREVFACLKHNGPYRRILTAQFLDQTGSNMFGALAVFYIEEALRLEGWTSRFVLGSMGTAAVLAPLAIYVYGKIGKHQVLMLSYGVYSVGYLMATFLPPSTSVSLYLVAFFIGLANSMTAPLVPAIVSDTTDYYALKTGRWRPGIFFAGYIFFKKLAIAVGSASGLLLVGLFGFQPIGANDSFHIDVLRIVATLIPAVLYGIAMLTLYNYPITANRHAAIRARLDRRSMVAEKA